MTRDEFIASNRIENVLETIGVTLVGGGDSRMCLCPFHKDKNPSMSVKLSEGIWHCHSCKIGGSVIDLMAKYTGISIPEFLKTNGIGNGKTNGDWKPIEKVQQPKGEIEKLYDYTDALGRRLYQVVRMKPKTFRQRHETSTGWVWSMEGVERVLYNLPTVTRTQEVWICEGEKDADNLNVLGYVATCNVGGAGKWLDGYTESLKGKDVVICGDTDKPGREHVELVFDSIAGKVKSAKLISLPSTFKDVSEYIAAMGVNSKKALDEMVSDAIPFIGGLKLPVYSLPEIESRYSKQARRTDSCSLSLEKWLPSLKVRPLVPGELMLVLGDTGAGKSAILQNIAATANIPTLFFEMELPGELLFERFAAIARKCKCSEVEFSYKNTEETLGEVGLKKFQHIFICPESRMTVDQIENYIVRSELKMGQKPKLVLIDYVQLIQGMGKRYERISDAAEGLKVVAKATQTIVVIASQVSRSEDGGSEIHLHSGKDSGALENSAGLVLGAWRDEKDNSTMHIKILKSTKGKGFGKSKVECNFDGERMIITEKSPITEESIPKQKTFQDDATWKKELPYADA